MKKRHFVIVVEARIPNDAGDYNTKELKRYPFEVETKTYNEAWQAAKAECRKHYSETQMAHAVDSI